MPKIKSYPNTVKEYTLQIKNRNTSFVRVKCSSSNIASDFARQFYFDDIEIFESFFMITMNRANIITGYVKISTGGTCGCIVEPMIVGKFALDSLAHSIILVHNHPSGNIQPSAADKDITKRIGKALDLFQIKVADHIIITKDNYFSFADYGECLI